MSFISIFRIVVLSKLLGLATLGITPSSTGDPIFFDFEGLGHWLSEHYSHTHHAWRLHAVAVLGAIRHGAFLSMIAVELCVLGLIWVLWLANAAVLTEWSQIFFPDGCGVFISGSLGFTVCQEFFALKGMSFTSWLLLMIYSGILLVLALMSKSQGNHVWTLC